jgi:hypothetical protein
MRGLVIRLGVPPQEAPDVVSNILVNLMQADAIGQYKPDFISPHTARPVTFRAFLSQKVALYVRGERDRLQRRGQRETLVGDATLEGGESWLDVFGGQWFDDLSGLDEQEFLDRMRTHLALREPPAPGDPDLLDLFDDLVREVRETGTFTRAGLCRRLGLPEATARRLVRTLRAEASEVLDPGHRTVARPQNWVIGGVRVGIPEVKSAIAVLEAARGIMVAQPLRSAGHPLAAAAKGWYHDFSRQEIKDYPAVAVDPQTHRKPAGHVKLAVLHRLRRMLAEVAPPTSPCEALGGGGYDREQGPLARGLAPAPCPPASEPEVSPSPLDLIEFEVRKLGADNAIVDRILSLVAQAGAHAVTAA